ncbi:MAG: FlgD immunoglobulin-like domain containing protein, partial [Candidatus Krumholzibacteria bacterium]|nr:FlgD immunoglobulin-like domain containing protein [Candidatus Krumholzibacteria bacterium]
DVRGNTVTGAGATAVTAQNGIQVWADLATGEVDENVVSGIGYAGTGWVATSILNYYGDLDYDGNTITDAHLGIYNIDGAGVIENNEVEVELIGDYCYGIVASDPPEARPSPFGEEEALGAAGRELLGAPLAVLDVDIIGNTVTNVGATVAGTYGIECDAGYGPNDLDLTIMYNTVCNFEAAIEVWNCQTGCDTGVFTSVVANYNYIGCGNTYGIRSNADYLTVDGTYNWWGDASGPYHATLNPAGTGDDVSDYVDFDPWLGAPSQLSVVPPYGTTTCLDPITFTFWFDHVGTDEVRGVDVTFQVDGGVVTIGSVGTDIVEGTYLPGVGSTTFFPLDMGGGVYRVSTAILGGTTGATGSGDLFAVTFTPVAEGLGAITITDLKVRDVNNVPLAASMVGGEVRVDCSGPTMEPIAEAEGVCYNVAPVFSNFGFDDDMNLDLAEYQIDADGWVTIFSGIDAAEWNDDGWTLPGFAGLSELSHTVYFRVKDDAGNLNDTYSWSFIKDTVPPEPPTGFTAMPGHNKVHLSWTNPAGDASFTGVEIRMVAWGDYPEYITAPSYPADHTGGTLVTQTPLEAYDDDPRTPRDIYYYAAFSYDCAGNYSVLGTEATDRSTSYWLGDIAGAPSWDGYINLSDLSFFSNTFGVAEGGPGWFNEADIGPTDDWSRFGIPEPDDVVDFEDLMIFSMNYGNVDPAGFDLVPADRTPENLAGMITFELVPAADGGTTVSVMLSSRAATLKGARLLIEAGEGCEIIGATKGEALAARGEAFFGTIPSHGGIEVCVAALGVDKSLVGSGEIARILVRSSGAVSIRLVEAEVRDLENRAFELEGTGGYQGPEIPVADALGQNFPNPFNPATTIAFDLARPAAVRIGIFDVSGRLVRTLVDGNVPAGRHEIQWNGLSNAGIGVPSGMYFYRMSTSEGFNATRKMIMLR